MVEQLPVSDSCIVDDGCIPSFMSYCVFYHTIIFCLIKTINFSFFLVSKTLNMNAVLCTVTTCFLFLLLTSRRKIRKLPSSKHNLVKVMWKVSRTSLTY